MSATAENIPAAGRRQEERLFLAIVVALAVIAGVGSWFAATALARHDTVRGTPPDKPRQLAEFTLTDSAGRTVTRADLNGKILAVSFLFTGCALTCPAVSQRMEQIQQLTTNLPDVRLVSLTVDPRTDTPEVLARWGARYGADSNRWSLLTGPKTSLYDLIGTSFLATDASDPFNYMPGNFTGTERIAVVDKRGRVRAYFDGTRPETPDAVVAEIDRLRQEP